MFENISNVKTVKQSPSQATVLLTLIDCCLLLSSLTLDILLWEKIKIGSMWILWSHREGFNVGKKVLELLYIFYKRKCFLVN